MNNILTNAHQTFANLALEKQQIVLKAAIHEFARQGYSGASINVIVKEAGISKGSLYQYFPNKEALFLFVFARFRAKVKATVKEVRSPPDFFDHIVVVLRAGINFIDRYPDYFQIYLKVMFERDVPQRHKLIQQVRLFSVDYFGPLCQQAQQQGEVRDDITLEMALFILDGTIERFLQTYAQPYLAGGLLILDDKDEINGQIAALVKVLRQGLQGLNHNEG